MSESDKPLDELLTSALAEFDVDEEDAPRPAAMAAPAGATAAPSSGAPRGGAAAPRAGRVSVAAAAEAAASATERSEAELDTSEVTDLAQNLAKLMEDMQNPDFAQQLEETFRQLQGGDAGGLPADLNPFAAAAAAQAGARRGAASGTGASDAADASATGEVDAGVARVLQMLAETSSGVEGGDAAAAEAGGEDMMKAIMEEFERMSGKEDFKDVMDGMMKQLLSRDVMYEPISQICGKYPEWLAENESKLSAEDYQRYGKQFQYFQQIIAVYNTEPNNVSRLMELMQEMQECGTPPEEIVKDLAPGLEFGPDGMPIMPGGAMPGMPGMPPMPGNCTVM